MAPHAEGAADQDPRLGRGRLLAGGLGALVATLVARVRPAAADDVIPGRPLLLETENVAETTTGLSQHAGSPALDVRNRSGPGIVSSALLPREAAISIPFAAGVVGSGTRLGVVGSSLPAEVVISIPFEAGLAGLSRRLGVVGSSLPAEVVISIPAGAEAGVAGFSERLGVVGSALMPQEAHITYVPTFRAGVAGVGDRLGVVGSSLPAEVAISIPFGFDAGVAGLSSRVGVVGSSLPAQATISMPHGLAAGVAGLGERLGVVGSSLPAQATISIPFGFDAGVAGFSESLGVVGAALMPEQAPITYVPPFRAGVVGTARGNDAVGILAENPDGYALRTIGKVAFSNGGAGMVPRGRSSVAVDDDTITEDSLVNVTLLDDPGAPGVALHYARPGRGSLRVVLTGPARRDTPFNYFVFDRA
jgi:hypothetical protein